MYIQRHAETAVNIIRDYDRSVPFAVELKKYFAEHKKHGSKDRKFITAFCYAYFRIGKALPENFDPVERLKIGMFLSENAERFADLFHDDVKGYLNESLSEKISFIHTKTSAFNSNNIFPFTQKLSSEIEANEFSQSHLLQPDVFLRARPNRKEIVENGLKKNAVEYTAEGNCVRIAPQIKIVDSIQVNRDAVVQDKNSQRVANLLSHIPAVERISVWDCCAASGGKSILIFDELKSRNPNTKIELTVSDVRESIIHNLKKRFSEAGINNYTAVVEDASKQINFTSKKYNLIVCDAPCSGSGTWGRTPEQLVYFKEEKIAHYANIQKLIAQHTSKHLSEKGFFLYITCSVFTAENEDVVKHIQDDLKLSLVQMKYFKGYNEKADTLFAALFTV